MAEPTATEPERREPYELHLPATTMQAIADAALLHADATGSSQHPLLADVYRNVAPAAAAAAASAKDGIATLRIASEDAQMLRDYRGSVEQAVRVIPIDAYDLATGSTAPSRIVDPTTEFTMAVGSEYVEDAAEERSRRAEWVLGEYAKRSHTGTETPPVGATLISEYRGDLVRAVQDPRFGAYLEQLGHSEETVAPFAARVLSAAGYTAEAQVAALSSVTEGVAAGEHAKVETRSVLGELDHREFSARANELHQGGRIAREVVQDLMDLAESSETIELFEERFASQAAYLMDTVSARYLTSALTAPEGRRPETFAESQTWVRAYSEERGPVAAPTEPSPAVTPERTPTVTLGETKTAAPEHAPAAVTDQTQAASTETVTPAEPEARSWTPEGVFAELDARGFAGRFVELRLVGAITKQQQESIMQMARDAGTLDRFSARLQYAGAQTLGPFPYKYLVSAVTDAQPATWAEAGEWVRQNGLTSMKQAAPEQAQTPTVDGLLRSAFPTPAAQAVTVLSSTEPAPDRTHTQNRAAQEPALTR